MISISLAGLFDVSFVHHGDEAVYAWRLYAFFRKYCKMAVEEDRFNKLLNCPSVQPNGGFYLVHDAAKWLSELDFERSQRMIAKQSTLACLHNLELFAIPSHERDMFYLSAQDVCFDFKCARTLAIPTLPVFSLKMDKM